MPWHLFRNKIKNDYLHLKYFTVCFIYPSTNLIKRVTGPSLTVLPVRDSRSLGTARLLAETMRPIRQSSFFKYSHRIINLFYGELMWFKWQHLNRSGSPIVIKNIDIGGVILARSNVRRLFYYNETPLVHPCAKYHCSKCFCQNRSILAKKFGTCANFIY